MMTKMTQDYGYGVIPVRKVGDGFEYLIIHHQIGHWGFPKGHKEAGESDLEAAKRELVEETGISDIEILPNAEFLVHYNLPPNDNGFEDKEVKLFLGISKMEPKVPESFAHEILEAKWCAKAEVESLFSRLEWVRALEEAGKYLEVNC